MIDFEEVGLQVFVQDDVETQQFKAHRTFPISRLTRPVIMQQVWLNREHGLDNDVFDLEEEGVCVVALGPQAVHDGLEAPLVALVIQGILGVLELTVILVYCVICQVNEHVFNVGIVKAARLELLGGKADDTLVVEEDL